MSNEKFQINLAPGIERTEVILREVNDANELPVQAPINVNLSGVIGAPFEFLHKRLVVSEDQIDIARSLVIVDREALTITLVTNENDVYKKGLVVGSAKIHPKFAEFGINTGRSWEPNELGQFFKMNRAYFPDKSENMQLVTVLRNFVAKINAQIDKQKDESGSFADNYSGVVTSNLPGAFKLKIQLFKGFPAEVFEVEFYASINGRSVFLQLYSPGANESIEEIRNSIIDEEIKKFREFQPNLAIIEQ